MSTKFSAVTMFCDDVRQEVGHTETIVGILPDNVNLPAFPIALPKIAIYTRIVVETDFIPEPIHVVLSTGGSESTIATIDVETISNAILQSKEKASPIVGFLARATAAPFPIEKPVRMLVRVTSENFNVISGTLNFDQTPQT